MHAGRKVYAVKKCSNKLNLFLTPQGHKKHLVNKNMM